MTPACRHRVALDGTARAALIAALAVAALQPRVAFAGDDFPFAAMGKTDLTAKGGTSSAHADSHASTPIRMQARRARRT